LSNKSLKGLYSNLSVFFNYLLQEDYVIGNPISIVKKNCGFLYEDKNVESFVKRRLSELQWNYLLETSEGLANDSPKEHERTLFVVAILKSLKLRISEISDRDNWSPIMTHFIQKDDNWWFTACGKGNKVRKVSVSDNFLPYLKRYRVHRGLSPLPLASSEIEPLILSTRTGRGLATRQIRNIVSVAFDAAYNKMVEEGFETDAVRLKDATTHWLRHTGASMEVSANRPLRHVQADLGHGSIKTTDELYVDSDDNEVAASAKKLQV
jgi:integrase